MRTSRENVPPWTRPTCVRVTGSLSALQVGLERYESLSHGSAARRVIDLAGVEFEALELGGAGFRASSARAGPSSAAAITRRRSVATNSARAETGGSAFKAAMTRTTWSKDGSEADSRKCSPDPASDACQSR